MAEANWYVVHTYSGYENKVKANIDKMRENRHLEENHYKLAETNECRTFLEKLPYQLTKGQEDALAEIRQDVAG